MQRGRSGRGDGRPGSEEGLRGRLPRGRSSREQGTLGQSWRLSVRDTGGEAKSLFKPFWSLVLYDSKVKQLGPVQAAVNGPARGLGLISQRKG